MRMLAAIGVLVVAMLEPSTGRAQLIKVLIVGTLLALLLVGCAPPAQVVRTQTVEVPKYIRTPIPAELVQPTVVVEPAPLCGSTFCNGQVATMLGDYRAGLNQCNADKSALRELNSSEALH